MQIISICLKTFNLHVIPHLNLDQWLVPTKHSISIITNLKWKKSSPKDLKVLYMLVHIYICYGPGIVTGA